ncbi:hypothetical protein [Streptomyces sp. NPDC048612]|uniref:hypothetical protein n=1 Tax=Streptomyces sp. NPDC048612 TaxID=3365579 RepID=UPI0037209864
MVILNLVLLGLLGVGILVYVTWRHPSLGTPFQVACGALAILVPTVVALARR